MASEVETAPFLVTEAPYTNGILPAKPSAWTTFLDHDHYLPGLIVLWDSLQRHQTHYPFVVLVTARVSAASRRAIKHAGMEMIDIEPVEHDARLANLPVDFNRFRFNWTKLRCWDLEQYDRLVFLDSDMLVVRNMDELFEIDVPHGHLAACVTCICRTVGRDYVEGWTRDQCGLSRYQKGEPRPITFYSHTPEHLLNSGMMVLRPDKATADLLTKVMAFDPIVTQLMTAEQDMLAHAFRHRFINLHWRYNGLKRMFQDHPDLWSEKEVSNIHFILEPKPWQQRVKAGDEFERLHGLWWTAFEEMASSSHWRDREELDTIRAQMAP